MRAPPELFCGKRNYLPPFRSCRATVRCSEEDNANSRLGKIVSVITQVCCDESLVGASQQ